jgi:hypothetical protein
MFSGVVDRATCLLLSFMEPKNEIFLKEVATRNLYITAFNCFTCSYLKHYCMLLRSKIKFHKSVRDHMRYNFGDQFSISRTNKRNLIKMLKTPFSCVLCSLGYLFPSHMKAPSYIMASICEPSIGFMG